MTRNLILASMLALLGLSAWTLLGSGPDSAVREASLGPERPVSSASEQERLSAPSLGTPAQAQGALRAAAESDSRENVTTTKAVDQSTGVLTVRTMFALSAPYAKDPVEAKIASNIHVLVGVGSVGQNIQTTYAEAVTDGAGLATVRIPLRALGGSAKCLKLQVDNGGYVPTRVDDTRLLWDRQPADGYDLGTLTVIVKAGTTISGHLFNKAGEPVQGMIDLYRLDGSAGGLWTLQKSVKADQLGAYRAEIFEAGTWRAVGKGMTTYLARSTRDRNNAYDKGTGVFGPFEISLAMPAEKIDIHTSAPGALRGVLLDIEGKPRPGVMLAAFIAVLEDDRDSLYRILGSRRQPQKRPLVLLGGSSSRFEGEPRKSGGIFLETAKSGGEFNDVVEEVASQSELTLQALAFEGRGLCYSKVKTDAEGRFEFLGLRQGDFLIRGNDGITTFGFPTLVTPTPVFSHGGHQVLQWPAKQGNFAAR